MRTHSCTHWLRPSNPSPPPYWGSYTRALLVSKDRRHLCCNPLILTWRSSGCRASWRWRDSRASCSSPCWRGLCSWRWWCRARWRPRSSSPGRAARRSRSSGRPGSAPASDTGVTRDFFSFKTRLKKLSQAEFRICDILIRIQIFGSVHWITDPDQDPALGPALFVSGLKDANKKYRFFCSLLTVGNLHQSSKITT